MDPSQFGNVAGWNGGADARGPNAKRARSELSSLGVFTGRGSNVVRGHFGEMTKKMGGGIAGATVFPDIGGEQMMDTEPIRVSLVTHLYRGELDENYVQYLQGSFVFSTYSKGDGVTPVLHLNRLNAKCREDHDAQVSFLMSDQQQNVARAGLGYLGLGIKRKHAVLQGVAKSEWGLYTMENFLKNIRYLGFLPSSDQKGDDADRFFFEGREVTLGVQFKGRIDEMTNLWGDIGVGDYLAFHVTRINNINEGSGFSSYADFGPIQIVPVASPNKTVAFGSSRNLHMDWAKQKELAKDPRNGTLPSEFGEDRYGPFQLRTGSLDPSLFDMSSPIRDIAHGRAPCDAMHWGPLFQKLDVPSGNGLTEKATLLSAELCPNLVLPVGRVMHMAKSAYGGLLEQHRRGMLMEGSGASVSQHKQSTVSIQLETYVH